MSCVNGLEFIVDTSDPIRSGGGSLWRRLRSSRLVTVGTLPPRVRRLLGIRWGRAGEEQLRLVFAGLRLAGATPARLRYLAPARQAFAEAAARAASRDGDWRRLGLEW